ncbi:hypothetical protein BKA69DRAFT_1171095 [Paraphysoderma sedebokerense]|nr:hypothetical protein BKA69DRAFT_1171095 [Paraphysoderma sedebokerense]
MNSAKKFLLQFLFFALLLNQAAFGSQLESVTVKITDVQSEGSNQDASNQGQICQRGVVCRTETDLIKDATINPVHWKLNKPVTFSFETTDKIDNPKYVHLAVHQVQELSGSTVPRHIFKGFILRTYQVTPQKRYEATFTPPHFWRSGKYILTLSLMPQVGTTPGVNEALSSFEQEFVLQTAAEADISFERVQHLLPPNSETDKIITNIDQGATSIELDTLRAILSNLNSASDQLCSIGSLEVKLQELGVKYLGLPNPEEAANRNSFGYITRMISEVAIDKKFQLLWTHEDFIEHVTDLFSSLLDEAGMMMESFFDEPDLKSMIREIPSFHLKTLSEISKAVTKLLELPTKIQFKEKLMDKFFKKYEGRLALLGFGSPAGAVAILLKNEQINSENEPEYAKWTQAILRAWDL